MLAEHITSLYRILGTQEHNREWDEISGHLLEFLGISEYDFEDIVTYAADIGIGG